MKSKVLILGSTGLFGHQVYNYLESLRIYDLYNIAYRKKLNKYTFVCNIRNEKKFIKIIKSISPDIIINCIGVLINGANLDPENAIFINSFIPHRLKNIANELDSKLIHISTDCVFSGEKKEPYIENDFKDGKDIYAKSKSLGEIISDNHLTLRTSIIGPDLKVDGDGLFNWFMSQSGSINGYTGAIWSGVTTLQLAKAVNWAIQNQITGLYHVTNNDAISKHDLLCLIKKHLNKEIEIKAVVGKELNKSFIDTRKEINYDIPKYEEMIIEMKEWILKNKNLYSHYNI